MYLILIFGFGWYKSAENRREYLALQEWNDRTASLNKEGMTEWRRLVARFRSLQAQPGSQKTLENELNGGRTFELHDEDGTDNRQFVDWSHPKYGGRYTFEFENGVLRGVSSGWGGVSEALNPQPEMLSRTNSAEQLRAQIVRVAPYGWLVTLVVWFIVTKWRLVTAQVLLTLALAAGMAWAVNPHYSITWSGVFSNDPLFFAAVMILISVVVLAITLAAQTRNDALRLQFGLRHALIAITLIAATLAAGPFGYLTLAVGGLGAALFATAYFVNRTHRRATPRWMAKRGYSQS